MFELKEDIPPCPLQAPLPVPGTVPGTIGVKHAVQKKVILMFLFTGYYTRGVRPRVENSQSTDSLYHRFPVVMKSETDVRYIESDFFGSTNLVIHQGVTNIFQ